MRTIVMLVCVAAGLLLFAFAQPPATKPEDAVAGQTGGRVVLRVNRNLEVRGHVEREDDNEIVVRNLQGEIESFPKSRILKIVRLVVPQKGQRGIVFLKNGQVRQGVIVEDAFDHVLVEIEGIRAKLKREQVDHVVLEPTFDQQYAGFKAALQPGMHEAHLSLCRWLFEERRYELARQELEELLAESDLHEAKELLTKVNAQLALKAADKNKDSPDAADDPANPDEEITGPVYPADMLPDEIITQADVNLIRVYELDFEHPVKVSISPETIRALIENHGTSKLIPASQTERTAMFRAEPLEIVRLMFELRARELYPQIQVNSEPYSLNLFRQRVHDTWLINNCATTQCHGGLNGGRLFLHRRNHKKDPVRYTNLLILERLKLDDQWPLINYDKPEDSLIIEYGLPRESARKPHPKVDGWKPAFGQVSQKLRQDAIEWIKSMMQPRPDYPVEYEPPILKKPSERSGEDEGDPARPLR